MDALPGAVTHLEILARALVRTGTLEAAVEALDELDVLEAIEPLDRASLWVRVVAATMTARWSIVRAAANALGFTFEPGDAPIDERWEPCWVRLVRDGSTHDIAAFRTGPVTARVCSLAEIDLRCVFNDEWVFDPRPVNALPPDATDEQKAQHIWIYPAVFSARRGAHRTFVLDGARLQPDAIDAIRERLARASVELRSHEVDYTLQDPLDPGREVEGEGFVVAAPPSVSDRDLAARLAEATADLPRPLVWHSLAVAIGAVAIIAAPPARGAPYGTPPGPLPYTQHTLPNNIERLRHGGRTRLK